MTGEAVEDLDALADEFMAAGILKVRLGSSFIPLTGNNHPLRRKFRFE